MSLESKLERRTLRSWR